MVSNHYIKASAQFEQLVVSVASKTIYDEPTVRNALQRISKLGGQVIPAEVIEICSEHDSQHKTESKHLEFVIRLLEEDHKKGRQLSEEEIIQVMNPKGNKPLRTRVDTFSNPVRTNKQQKSYNKEMRKANAKILGTDKNKS